MVLNDRFFPALNGRNITAWGVAVAEPQEMIK